MPIFEAEVRGKICPEDMLTSRVFGTLAILEKRKVLNPLLQRLGVSLPDEEVNQASIQFWEYYDGTYPDVSITTTNHLVFIEVKETAVVESYQLKQQYKAGATEAKNKGINFLYFILTKDKQKPIDVTKAERALVARYPDAKIHWKQWREIWYFLKKINSEPPDNDVSRCLIEDLISLLEVKRMKYPSGLEPDWFQKVGETIPSLLKLCRETQVIIEKLNEDAVKFELVPMKPMPLKATSPKLENPDEWIWRQWEFPYKDKSWKRIRKPYQNYKELYLYIGFDLDEAKVQAGFFTDHASEKQMKEARAKVKKGEGIQLHTFDENKRWLALSYDLPLEKLTDGTTVVKRLADKLIKTRDFVNSLETFHEELGLKGLKQVKKRR